MIEKEQIEKIVEVRLANTDKFLVDVKIKPTNKIFVFIDSDENVSIEDCVELSRHIESHFNRDMEDFELNVSSAGMDHPLVLERQFKKQTGKDVDIVLNNGKKISGTLKSYDKNGLSILRKTEKKKKKKQQAAEDPEIRIDFKDIKETKKTIKF